MSESINWTEDELILALDLYWCHSTEYPMVLSRNDPKIKELSDLLKKSHQIAPNQNCRSINSIHMKLMSFLRFDSRHSGTGLSAGSKLDQIIWDEYVNDQKKLSAVASAIRERLSADKTPEEKKATSSGLEWMNNPEAPEGRILLQEHIVRERNAKLIEAKKASAADNLNCEVCGFSFSEFYGELAEGYIECHHTKPVWQMKAGDKTKLDDLALVCANCHRVLHRKKRTLSIDELRKALRFITQ